MSIDHSAYFAYGVRIPNTDTDTLEEVLQARPETEPDSVGYLHAGHYESDTTFLVTEFHDVDLGEYKTVTPQAFDRDQTAAWDKSINAAAAQLGHTEIPAPGWLVIPTAT